MDTRRFVVAPENAGDRLDAFLASACDGILSRSRLKALIEEGSVRIAGQTMLSPKRKVAEGEEVALSLPAPEDPTPRPQAIPLAIVFEDCDLIVVDKPAGLVVHPGPGNWTGTLVNALLHHCGDTLSGIGGVKRPGIVHRLDKDTSGLLVVAKSDAAHRGLSEQFAAHGRDGRLTRSYLAAVWGRPPRPAGTVNAPLGRAANDRVKRSVVPSGRADAREAITHYAVLASAPDDLASLVECRLETGRTHQIRVHMTHIGHPLVGDDVYGAGFRTKAERLEPPARAVVSGFGRQALHARSLGFVHPVSGEAVSFFSPLPPEMTELCTALEISAERTANADWFTGLSA
ncbi:RluA family pseudouridine synthase [Aurantimonas sp. VKM B-3413]|uniref:RluA family pseudouridine synthase n=1 Tax=Aurantimonas sp. VKM B-3413 TaxID=2779401 RepID=UPI001E5BA772|nr:RluA family pseudouridine synthase [Aurantimonas sp. VKM B-3413]MCB8837975.1 RluA family pseudouridine synthase [Aurantimonas sp. VKM B-3413]